MKASKIFLGCCIWLLATVSAASPLPYLVPETGRYVYLDRNGQRITDATYEKAGLFTSGLAIVENIREEDGTHYRGRRIIDETGNTVLQTYFPVNFHAQGQTLVFERCYSDSKLNLKLWEWRLEGNGFGSDGWPFPSLEGSRNFVGRCAFDDSRGEEFFDGANVSHVELVGDLILIHFKESNRVRVYRQRADGGVDFVRALSDVMTVIDQERYLRYSRKGTVSMYSIADNRPLGEQYTILEGEDRSARRRLMQQFGTAPLLGDDGEIYLAAGTGKGIRRLDIDRQADLFPSFLLPPSQAATVRRLQGEGYLINANAPVKDNVFMGRSADTSEWMIAADGQDYRLPELPGLQVSSVGSEDLVVTTDGDDGRTLSGIFSYRQGAWKVPLARVRLSILGKDRYLRTDLKDSMVDGSLRSYGVHRVIIDGTGDAISIPYYSINRTSDPRVLLGQVLVTLYRRQVPTRFAYILMETGEELVFTQEVSGRDVSNSVDVPSP